MELNEINFGNQQFIASELARCCGSPRWVEQIVARRPFASKEECVHLADEIW